MALVGSNVGSPGCLNAQTDPIPVGPVKSLDWMTPQMLIMMLRLKA